MHYPVLRHAWEIGQVQTGFSILISILTFQRFSLKYNFVMRSLFGPQTSQVYANSYCQNAQLSAKLYLPNNSLIKKCFEKPTVALIMVLLSMCDPPDWFAGW